MDGKISPVNVKKRSGLAQGTLDQKTKSGYSRKVGNY